MINLYTEEQYEEYSNLCEKIINQDDILKGFNTHLEIENWIKDSKLLKEAIDQMDCRMEDECIKECK